MASTRFKRRLAIGLVGGLVGSLVALALVLHLAGPAIVQPVLVGLLERQGLGPVQLRVERVGLAGLRVADLRLGATGALRAAAVDVAISPWRLAAGRVDQITLSGLRLAATVDAAGQVSVPGLASSSPAGSSAALPPLDRLVLDDAQVAASTPWGNATVRLDGALTVAADGLASETRLDAALGAWHLTVRALKLATRPAGGWHVEVAQAAVTAPAFDLAADAIDGTLDWNADHATVAASIAHVRDTRAPARVVQLAATLHAERRGDAITFDVTAHDPKGDLQITAKGHHALGAQRGSAQVSATPRRFAVDHLQPRDLTPALGAALPPLDGTLSVAGTIGWSRSGLEPTLTLTLSDTGLDLGSARITGAHGAIQIDGIAPPSTPPGQRVSAVVAVGATTLPLELAVQLRRDGAIVVSSLVLGVADGQLALRDIVVPAATPGAPPVDLALPVAVTGTDLATLLELVAIDGLSGTGRLDGTLPLRLIRRADGSSQIALDHGRLDARAAGLIRYVGSALPKPSGAGADAVGLLSDALKDFHYESLALELDRRPDGPDGAVLHLAGANPAVLAGRKFVLNIRLDADFDRLLAVFLAGLDAAGRLTRELATPKP